MTINRFLLAVLLLTGTAQLLPAQGISMQQTIYYINTVLRQHTITKNIDLEDSLQATPQYTLSYQVDVDDDYNIEIKVIKDYSVLHSVNIIDPTTLEVEQLYKTQDNDAILLNCQGRTECIRKQLPSLRLSYYSATLKLEIEEGALQAKNLRDAFRYLVRRASEQKLLIEKEQINLGSR